MAEADPNPTVSPYRYRVHIDMLFPVRARAGDVLIVRPWSEARPIVVIRKRGDRWRCIRIGPPNFGALIGLDLDGVISELTPSLVALADHPAVRTA